MSMLAVTLVAAASAFSLLAACGVGVEAQHRSSPACRRGCAPRQ